MKKLFLVILMLFIVGCNKDESIHYSLKGKDVINYFENGKKYSITRIDDEIIETNYTGLFYKVGDDDYILLEKLENSNNDAYKNIGYYRFYDNKLFGVGNGKTPMIFVVNLDGKDSSLEELHFKYKDKTNPFFVFSIQDIHDETIVYSGYYSENEHSIDATFSCSLTDYTCEINEK